MDEQILLTFWSGRLQEAIDDPQTRLALSHTCQVCERDYKRSGDLHIHLQQAHASLFHQGIPLQKFLVEKFYVKMGCMCSPITEADVPTHICPLFTQLAVIATRYRTKIYAQPMDTMPDHAGILVPGYFEPDWVAALVHETTPAEVKDALITRLCGHQWMALWQQDSIVNHLRSHCIICGMGPLTPGALHNHMLEEHGTQTKRSKLMLQQLCEPLRITAPHTHMCCMPTSVCLT